MINFEKYINCSEYIDIKSLLSLFDNYWDELNNKFRKFEHLQYYNEGLNSAMVDYLNEDYSTFTKKLLKTKESEKPFYIKSLSKGVSFNRIHLIKHPISKYIEFEYYSYYVNSALGENIYCKNYDVCYNFRLYDFMIFDDNRLLINDYDKDGNLIGGWNLKEGNLNLINELINWYDEQLKSAYDFKQILVPRKEILESIL